MFPKTRHFSPLSHQQGFLLPLALFILVVMGVLAITISRTSIQTQESSVYEYSNLQAFYAAESGAQRGMNHLFFDATVALTRAGVDTRCTGWTQTYTFTSDGLRACVANVGCTRTTDAANLRSFYTVTSRGACGTDAYRAERTIQVSAFME